MEINQASKPFKQHSIDEDLKIHLMIVNGIERDYIVHDENNIKGFFGEYRWLSNFHVCDTYFDGEMYGSSEAAYVAGKTLDYSLRKKLIGMSPAETKKFGRTFPLRKDWDRVKVDHMSLIVFDKFYRNRDLRDKLVDTGDKYLEETNHWGDRFFGVCKDEGINHLGKILMKTRSFWQNDGYTRSTPLF